MTIIQTLTIWFIVSITNQRHDYRQSLHNQLVSRNRWDSEYDYIVVGAGSAGCVVAARLTEDPSVKVLLIEAGGAQTVESDMPGRQQYLYGTELNWNYPTVSQTNAHFAFKNNTANIARGKGFGGSSIINRMNYYRGNVKIFDLWETTYGAKGWSYKDVLPYFLKSENNVDGKLVAASNGAHKTGGPITVSTVKPDIMLERFVNAAKRMGYSETDIDGRNQYGVTIMQTNTKNGVRQSLGTAFLEPNVYRRNLHILGHALGTKILFDDNDSKTANGVQFYRNGKYHTVRASKEVLVSAGVNGSPKLLMLSGIGPREHLEQLNISVISDLRVGDNYHGEAGIALNFDIKNQSEIQKPELNLQNRYDYLIFGSGPLAYVASGLMCFNSSFDWIPDIPSGCIFPRVLFMGDNLDGIVRNYKLKEEWKQYYKPYLNRSYFSLFANLQLTKSVGTLRLASANPLDHPIIDPKIFDNPSDLDVLVDTIKSALRIYQSDYFKQYAEIYSNPIPGCKYCDNAVNKFCDTYLRCVAQTITYSVSPVGSCKMGSFTDPTAVVDERLRVKGVLGLRVIDSSVFPLLTVQMNAVTVMIGERGAEFVQQDNRS